MENVSDYAGQIVFVQYIPFYNFCRKILMMLDDWYYNLHAFSRNRYNYSNYFNGHSHFYKANELYKVHSHKLFGMIFKNFLVNVHMVVFPRRL